MKLSESSLFQMFFSLIFFVLKFFFSSVTLILLLNPSGILFLSDSVAFYLRKRHPTDFFLHHHYPHFNFPSSLLWNKIVFLSFSASPIICVIPESICIDYLIMGLLLLIVGFIFCLYLCLANLD